MPRILTPESIMAGTPLDIESELAQNLVGFWPCWEGGGKLVEDISGNGNHGIINGGVTPVPANAGIFGTAWSKFASITGYISVGDPAALRNLPRWTIAAFVRPTDFLSSTINYTITKYPGWAFGFSGSFNAGHSLLLFDGSTVLLGNTAFVNGGVYLMVATFDGSKAALFLNGQPDNTPAAFAPGNDSGHSLFLGNRSDGNSSNELLGELYFSAIWPTTLSAAQVSALYNSLTYNSPSLFVSKRIGQTPTFLAPTKRFVSSSKRYSESVEVGTPLNIESDLAQNLAGFWPIWEGGGKLVEDISGNGNHGTINGGVTPVSASAGIFGEAWQFDGSTGYIAINDSPSLRLTNSLTLAVRVKSTSAGSDVGIARKDTLTTRPRTLWGLAFVAGKIAAQWYNGTTIFQVISSASLNDNKWHDAVMTISGTTLTLWIDTVSQGTTTISGSQTTAPNGELNFAAEPPNADTGVRSGFMSGQIEFGFVWPFAMNAAQVSALYNSLLYNDPPLFISKRLGRATMQSVGGLLTIIYDAIFDISNISTIKQDEIYDIENLKSMLINQVYEIYNLLSIKSDYIEQTYNMVSLLRDGIFDINSLMSIVRNETLNINNISYINSNQSIDSNNLENIIKDATAAVAFTLLLKSDTVIDIYNLGGIKQDSIVDVSVIGVLTADKVYNTYSLGQIQLDRIHDTNYLSSILKDNNLNVNLLRQIAYDAIFDVDWDGITTIANKIYVLDSRKRVWVLDAINRSWVLDKTKKVWGF